MPVKLGQQRRAEPEARIEIIPLIDIMFFLLAAFMLVSLSMVHLHVVPVTLPTATTATPETRRDLAALTVDKTGQVYLENALVGPNELVSALVARRKANPDLRLVIGGDEDSRHGDLLRVLDWVRAAGIEKVAFEVRPSNAPR